MHDSGFALGLRFELSGRDETANVLKAAERLAVDEQLREGGEAAALRQALDRFGIARHVDLLEADRSLHSLGVTAGAADAELGLLRDLIATGRSRVALFASRAVAALLLTLAILAAALAVVTTLSIVLAGSAHVPSWSEIIQRDVAVLGFGASCALVCTGLGAFVRTRGPMMASVIAFGVLLSQLLLRTGFLGSLRGLLPLGAFDRAVGDSISGLHISLALAIAVLPSGHSPRWLRTAGGPDASRSDPGRTLSSGTYASYVVSVAGVG